MKLSRLFFFAIIFFCDNLFSQETFSISGYTKDKKDGEVLPFVNVSIVGLNIGASTNSYGYFAIPKIPIGKHQIKFSIIGYANKIIQVDLLKDEKLNVLLSAEDLKLDEVVISADIAERKITTQSSRIVIQIKDLQKLPVVGELDVFRLLQMMPGVKSSSEISSGLYVRGGSPDQNLILLDGTVVYNPSHLFGFFSTFNSDAVKDIELIKGGLPAEFGGRLSAVLNVTNKDGNRNETNGKVSLGMISSRFTIEGPIKWGSWFLSWRRTYLDQIISLANLDEGEFPVPLYYFYDGNGKINFDISENDKLSISGYLGKDNLNFKIGEGTNLNLWWGNSTSSLKWTHIFSPIMFSNFILTQSNFNTSLKGGAVGSEFLFQNYIKDISFKGDFDFYATNEHLVKIGFWWSNYDFKVYREFSGNIFYDLNFTPTHLSLYLQDDWIYSAFWSFRAGLRAEYNSATKNFDFNPRFSVRRNISDQFAIKFSTGIYHQYMQLVGSEGFSFFDMWVPIDEKMKPANAIDYVFSFETNPIDDIEFNLELYYKKYSNTLEFKNQRERTFEINKLFYYGNGSAYGFEIFTQKKLGEITGFVGYTLAWTKRKFDEINFGNEFYPKYDRRHDISVALNYNFSEDLTFGMIFSYASGQTFTVGNGRYSLSTLERRFENILATERYNRRLEPYHRLDIGFTKQKTFFGYKGSWYVQIYNLYNHRNVWFKDYDTSENPVKITDVRLIPILPTIGMEFKF
ncbi:MAG: TonB-dependent receptor [Bacteroidota bacterium]